MSGHRRLLDAEAARLAVRQEIASLMAAAEKMGARLMAVSSIALGADLIFAEECLAAGVPWKCLLPFAKEEFRRDDFTEADWSRVEACLEGAYRVVELMPGVPEDEAQRKSAYLECGYRMVEQADVVLLLWNGKPAQGEGGTGDVWDYARILSKPVWHRNTETSVINRAGWPGEGEWAERRLFKSRVADLMEQTIALPTPKAQTQEEFGKPCSAAHGALVSLFTRFDSLAMNKQVDAQRLMQKVVRAHLLATTAAALSVTVVANGCWHELSHAPLLAAVAIITFSFLVLAKPFLAGLAMRWEKQLHHLKSREVWVKARVAAELCRSAAMCWKFPQAPLPVFEDEDFPVFKRLMRTLRLARELDGARAVFASEADAVTDYVKLRIGGQLDFFDRKHAKAVIEHASWQRKFKFATWFVIVAGSTMGLLEATMACCSLADAHGGHIGGWLHAAESIIACLLIIAPFYASYALGMLAIKDCSRRRDRYARMKQFLERQKTRLLRAKTAASRIAIVENTERMLLEELHEWYSVMREVRV